MKKEEEEELMRDQVGWEYSQRERRRITRPTPISRVRDLKIDLE